MDGVVFLSSKKVVTKTKFNWNAFWPFELLSIIAFLCTGLYMLEINNAMFKIIGMFLLSILFGSVFGCLAGIMCSIPVRYGLEHNIVVLDETSIDKIKEKYEIVEQNDKWWTIREGISE